VRAHSGFDPNDPQKAIERAKEILAEAESLLGVQAHQPLSQPIAKTGAVSAQVFFREEVAGLPLSPSGNVTVDLGPQGELVGLHSDYVRDVKVENSPQLDRESAKQRALLALSDTEASNPGKPEGGAHIIWIAQRLNPGESTSARHAFAYLYQGRQVVIDAQTGSILSRRDRREF
jgi:hypothetical protein